MYCKRCGAPLHQGVVLCPECGARQRRQAASVRCASCHDNVPMGLTVCPHCGRSVRPAGPRWGLWLTALVVFGLIGLWGVGKLPVESAVEDVKTARARLAGLVEVLGPAASATAEPAEVQVTPQALALAEVEGGSDAGTEPVAEAPAPEALPAEGQAVGEETPAAGEETPVAAAEALTPTVTLPPTELPTLEPTGTNAPTATATFTPEPTATATLPPTETPTAVPPTATQPPAAPGKTTYKVRSGDTLSVIADRYGITWQELAEANGLSSRSTMRTGQELVIPVKGAAAGAAAAPAAAAASTTPTTYKVRSGDTLSLIAQRLGITWQELANANGLTSRSTLRIGQELKVPGKGSPAATTAPTETPKPAATSAPPTATARPVAEMPAPALVTPGDQATFTGDGALVELKWNPVQGMTSDYTYQVVVRWTEQGGPEEHWWFTPLPGSRVPPWLWGRADQPDRKYTWFVRVVQVTTDGQGQERVIPASQPSASRVLYWQ
jgi:LysM repeat protein